MIEALCLEACALVSTLIVTDFNLKTVDATREYGGVVIGKTRNTNTHINGRELDTMTSEEGAQASHTTAEKVSE